MNNLEIFIYLIELILLDPFSFFFAIFLLNYWSRDICSVKLDQIMSSILITKGLPNFRESFNESELPESGNVFEMQLFVHDVQSHFSLFLLKLNLVQTQW